MSKCKQFVKIQQKYCFIVGLHLLINVKCFLFLTQTAEGVGRLLFEMVKGVQKQFHSCTQKVGSLQYASLQIHVQYRYVLWEF